MYGTDRIVCILELLFIRCHFYTLQLFTHSEIDSIINFFVYSLVFIVFLLFSSFYVYDHYDK